MQTVHCQRGTVAFKSCAQRPHCRSRGQLVCHASGSDPQGRREILLKSVNVLALGALFNVGAAPRPKEIGILDYGGGVKTLALCPPTPTCISTSEELNDPTHYVPPWTYNPEDGRGLRKPASQEQAMAELVDVIKSTKPGNYDANIVQQTKDFLYVEYTSPILGFIDDVEFWFKPGPGFRVEYRSASRVGFTDGDANRKRIKDLREALQKKGWRSVGF